MIKAFTMCYWASLVAQRVKRLPAMQEAWVWCLGQENSLEKEMETHSSTLAWKIPWTKKPGTVHGIAKSRTLSDFTFTIGPQKKIASCLVRAIKTSPEKWHLSWVLNRRSRFARCIKEFSLDESERGEWKSWLKTQHSENEDHVIQSHQFSSVA